ncbi:MAG: hypothetical protein ABI690_19640 [Chloroflexota bacterium]
MGHNITWDNQAKTVVLQEYTDGASKDDLYHLAQKSAELLQTVKHTVHLIIDERKINLILSSTDMKYLAKTTPPNQGAVVMVIPPSKLAYKTAVQGLGKLIGAKAFAQPYFVGSLDEARRFLQESFDVVYLLKTAKKP